MRHKSLTARFLALQLSFAARELVLFRTYSRTAGTSPSDARHSIRSWISIMKLTVRALFVILYAFLLLYPCNALIRDYFNVASRSEGSFLVEVSWNRADDVKYVAAVRRGIEITEKRWPSKVNLNVIVRFQESKGVSSVLSSPVRFVKRETADGVENIQLAAWETLNERDADHNYPGDIEINLNQNAIWHLNDSQPVPSTAYDLSTVVVQQLYHHLIFSGNLRVKRNRAGVQRAYVSGDGPSRFDNLLVNEEECPVLDYLTNGEIREHLKMKREMLLASALTNGRLYFARKDFKLNAPLDFTKNASVYHLKRTGAWSLMQPDVPPGERVKDVPQEILDIQELYLSPSVAPRHCSRLSDPRRVTVPALLHVSRHKRIAGLPGWAFGLCMVLLGIVIFVLSFVVCTYGAIAKQKEKRSCWKSLTWCCTGVNVAPDGPEKPMFVLVDERTAQKMQSSRNSVEAVRIVARSSMDAARNSLSAARSSINASRVLLELRAPEDDVESVPSADITDTPAPAAETQLPGRLQTQ